MNSKIKRTDGEKKAPTGGELIAYEDQGEKEALAQLERREDFDAKRLSRLLSATDLTRKENSPVKFIIDKVLQLDDFKNFDVVSAPETITPVNGFDLFNFPIDHPSRSSSDTYFINPERILRTHTTSMWFYYLNDSKIREKLEKQKWLGEISFGKVYRKDEIDSKHFPVFHQIDGLYICKREDKQITLKTLQDVLENIVKSVFGPKIEFKFLSDQFPFTDPSTQIEIKRGSDWIEIVGAGIVHKKVLKNFNIDPEIYHGWAFGFGIERLAMIKNNIPDIRILWSEDARITSQFKNLNSKFKEVSKYPAIVRDISFVIKKDTSLNFIYEIVRHLGGDLVEELKKLDEYSDEEKFGPDKKSYTFRIVFRSNERTLTNEEINKIYQEIERMVVKELKAKIR